jgi:surface antigen
MKKKIFWLALFTFALIGGFQIKKYLSKNSQYEIGQAIDSLHYVKVYYNGSTGTILGRNTVDGYNLGLKYQCVEFVKRYYFEHFQHRMPNVFGNAVDFFDVQIADGDKNTARDLYQFTNPSRSKPKVGDLIVMNGGAFGHVAIISEVRKNEIQIIQQNPGAHAESRVWYDLEKNAEGKWYIGKRRILGWLRK